MRQKMLLLFLRGVEETQASFELSVLPVGRGWDFRDVYLLKKKKKKTQDITKRGKWASPDLLAVVCIVSQVEKASNR